MPTVNGDFDFKSARLAWLRVELLAFFQADLDITIWHRRVIVWAGRLAVQRASLFDAPQGVQCRAIGRRWGFAATSAAKMPTFTALPFFSASFRKSRLRR